MRSRLKSRLGWSLLGSAAALVLSFSPAAAGFLNFRLDSDIPGKAAFDEPTLVNPWGLAASGGSPWWIANNGTGLSTLYDGNTGQKRAAPVVTIPPPAGGTTSAPTGVVFNGSASFALPTGGKASFIFSTEDGTIAGWNGAQGTTAFLAVHDLPDGPVFNGLAIGKVGTTDYLYASDFKNGKVWVFDTSFASVTLAGTFIDPTLPAGFAPFGIQNIGGNIYVTFAEQSPGSADEIDGAGLGYVSEFNPDGTFMQRIASAGTLDAPWGIALSPANFGDFSNDLLIGNFGDGTINAFDTLTNAFLGQLPSTRLNQPIVIDGLWGIAFGNGGSAGPTNALFYTAGIHDEANGLFGDLKFIKTPEPATLALFGAGLIGLSALRRRKARKDT